MKCEEFYLFMFFSTLTSLDKVSHFCPFCLHTHFSKTLQNRLKCSRPYFCTPEQKEGLKSHAFYKPLCRKKLSTTTNILKPIITGQIDNFTLQNRPFHRVFAHFLTRTFVRHHTGKFQTRRVMFAIITCLVGRHSTLNWQIRRVLAAF